MTYFVNELTIDQLRDIICSGDDSHANQLRIKRNGEIFLSCSVGADDLDGIRGRFETFDAHNGYVGPRAAADDSFINRLFAAIQAWREDPSPATYIDTW